MQIDFLLRKVFNKGLKIAFEKKTLELIHRYNSW